MGTQNTSPIGDRIFYESADARHSTVIVYHCCTNTYREIPAIDVSTRSDGLREFRCQCGDTVWTGPAQWARWQETS